MPCGILIRKFSRLRAAAVGCRVDNIQIYVAVACCRVFWAPKMSLREKSKQIPNSINSSYGGSGELMNSIRSTQSRAPNIEKSVSYICSAVKAVDGVCSDVISGPSSASRPPVHSERALEAHSFLIFVSSRRTVDHFPFFFCLAMKKPSAVPLFLPSMMHANSITAERIARVPLHFEALLTFELLPCVRHKFIFDIY